VTTKMILAVAETRKSTAGQQFLSPWVMH